MDLERILQLTVSELISPIDGVPPPNSYATKTDFNKNPGAKAFSFGIAREAYSKVRRDLTIRCT